MLESVRDDLERDLGALDREIARLDAQADQEMASATDLVTSARNEGVLLDPESPAFDEVDAAYLVADATREKASRLRQRRERVAGRLVGAETPVTIGGVGRGGWSRAFQLLSESEGYRRLAASGALVSQSAHVNIDPVEVMSREAFGAGLRNWVGHATDTQALVDDDQRRIPPVPIPVRMPRVMDLVLSTTTDTDNVIYAVETVRTDAAAETAVGTDSPLSDYQYVEANAPVRPIVHHTVASKYNLADAGQAQAILEGRIRTGLDLRADTQMISGAGTGQHLLGILNTSGIGSQARGTVDSRLIALHKGVTKVRLALFDEPDAIGLHPTDYEETVFETGSDGQFLLGPASQQTSRTIWGFPAVVSAVFPVGTGLVGNYRAGATAWVRSGPDISISDDGVFLKRQVIIMGEFRMAFAAGQPRAFAQVTGI